MNCADNSNSTAIVALIAGVFSILVAIFNSYRQSASQKEIEKMKSGFKWDEIRLAKLRDEQGAIFRELYSKLVSLFIAAKGVAKILDEKREDKQLKLEIYKNSAKEFWNAYESQKIWLNNPLCALIDKFLSDMDTALLGLEACLASEFDINDRTFKATKSAWESLIGEVFNTKKEIESKFRDLMRV